MLHRVANLCVLSWPAWHGAEPLPIITPRCSERAFTRYQRCCGAGGPYGSASEPGPYGGGPHSVWVWSPSGIGQTRPRAGWGELLHQVPRLDPGWLPTVARPEGQSAPRCDCGRSGTWTVGPGSQTVGAGDGESAGSAGPGLGGDDAPGRRRIRRGEIPGQTRCRASPHSVPPRVGPGPATEYRRVTRRPSMCWRNGRVIRGGRPHPRRGSQPHPCTGRVP